MHFLTYFLSPEVKAKNQGNWNVFEGGQCFQGMFKQENFNENGYNDKINN